MQLEARQYEAPSHRSELAVAVLFGQNTDLVDCLLGRQFIQMNARQFHDGRYIIRRTFAGIED